LGRRSLKRTGRKLRSFTAQHTNIQVGFPHRLILQSWLHGNTLPVACPGLRVGHFRVGVGCRCLPRIRSWVSVPLKPAIKVSGKIYIRLQIRGGSRSGSGSNLVLDIHSLDSEDSHRPALEVEAASSPRQVAA
jgi:hypothetical protein